MATPSSDLVTKVFNTYRFCLQANNLLLTGTMDPPGIFRCPETFKNRKKGIPQSPEEMKPPPCQPLTLLWSSAKRSGPSSMPSWNIITVEIYSTRHLGKASMETQGKVTYESRNSEVHPPSWLQVLSRDCVVIGMYARGLMQTRLTDHLKLFRQSLGHPGSKTKISSMA